ncbi:MAG TPA: protease complex subunit PrcB family protein [Gemmatimonadales bacterium]|nr:protease complex subunit PrcB family protein [Gemmatimonadales bacterium]
MTRRMLSLLLLLPAVGCGSGRIVRGVDSPAPATADPGQPTAIAPPSAGADPAPQVTPAPGDPGASAYTPYSGDALQIRRIGQWSTSGITAPARLVIRDDTAYARFWTDLGGGGSRPSVDFTRDVVIVAASGQKATGGHAIAVERVTRSGQGLAVEVVETAPGAGCMITQSLTQPVDVIVVAAADAQTWSFTDQIRSQPCQ